MIDTGYWLVVRDGDPRGRSLYLRHYSAKPRARRSQAIGNQARFAGIGEHLVLLTADCRALFVWRKERFRLDGQQGVNCAIFRNEGSVLSSALIREACNLAWRKWPGERLFTFVNPRKVRSPNPGYCFKMAGWHQVPGRSKKRRLVILEKLPGT